MKHVRKLTKCYWRNLLDMHIEDWHEDFLSRFDAGDYVRKLELAGVQAAMVYANSHVGHCYWPTKVGHVHPAFRGRDVLAEVVALCHEKEMAVILYYSLLFNNWAHEHFPEWRILDVDGNHTRVPPTGPECSPQVPQWARYGVCCPNSGYRRFVAEQIEELCRGYEFEGIFFDMTFWHSVCYCAACTSRFRSETGLDLPRVVDWQNGQWLRFQGKREEWINEFARFCTQTVKALVPQVQVEHQFSSLTASWQRGVNEGLAEAVDHVDGDFYGGRLEESFICKAYWNLTPKAPFVFSTACGLNLSDHTTRKSKAVLEAESYLALAHGGAFLFIDAIDPVGTTNEALYRLMGEIQAERQGYEAFVGGQLCQDIAIYFSLLSKFDPADSKKKPNEASQGQPHLAAALGAARALRRSHLPFGIITRKNLGELDKHDVIVLPGMLWIEDEEIRAFKQFVASGGSIYFSGYPLIGPSDALAELLGIAYKGRTEENTTYFSPTPEGLSLLAGASRECPLGLEAPQVLAGLTEDATVLATITLPYTNPHDPSRFASIHSNPPGIATAYPAIIRRGCGQGTVMWVAGPLEGVTQEPHERTFVRLIESLSSGPFSFRSDAPASVEVVMFHQSEKRRYIVNLVNFQPELPNIPVRDLVFSVRAQREVVGVSSASGGSPLDYEAEGEYIRVHVPLLKTFEMVIIEHE